MKTSKGSFGYVIPACVALALAGSAFAADSAASRMAQADTDSMHVGYGDLDLTTQRGAQHLVWRIRRAAETICVETDPAYAVGPSREDLKCEEEKIAQALAQVRSPMVSEEYDRETHRASASVVAEGR